MFRLAFVLTLLATPAYAYDKAATKAVEEMLIECTQGRFRRSGPSSRQNEGCNKAEKVALDLGAPAALAATKYLDAADLFGVERARLFDVITRVGDVDTIDPLIRLLEQADVLHVSPPAQLKETLERITYARLVGKSTLECRRWADEHRGRTRSQLLAERLGAVEHDLAQGSLDARIDAAAFLARIPQSRLRARDALIRLQQLDLDEHQRERVQRLLVHAPDADITTELPTS